MLNFNNFNTEENCSAIPTFEEKTIDEIISHQIKNFETERSKLLRNDFKKKMDN